MSSAVLKGNASGTGIVTLESPNTNTDMTIALPARAGNLMMDGPAFRAYLNTTQNISASTFTKIQVNAESFDTNNNFDSTTNYRFTPTVAGYYFFQGSAIFQQTSGSAGIALIAIYKNGGNIAQNELTSTFTSGLTLQTSTLAYMNGTTDYVEIYGYTAATSGPSIAPGADTTWFNGFLVRGA